MKVLKFGGTSVGSSERMKEVVNILEMSNELQIVVLSAMSGTTNQLAEICYLLRDSQAEEALDLVDILYGKYLLTLNDLFKKTSVMEEIRRTINGVFEKLRIWSKIPFTDKVEKQILALGELMTSEVFHTLCVVQGHTSVVLPALEYMRIDEAGEPDMQAISKRLLPLLSQVQDHEYIITQGFICKNHLDEVDNLQRGGSDYTATIIGAVVEADEIQIWTDIDGIHNNDPRIVESTEPIRKLSYREAAELAYFGAKILHPTCVLPAEKMGVPLRLKYTMEPEKSGTLIGRETSKRPITAIAAKDGITAIKIYSHRMLMAYGFLKKVFQIFEDFETPIDMIATSEVAISLTIDRSDRTDQILEELAKIAEVEASNEFSIICIVGNDLYDDPSLIEQIFRHLKEIPVRMVSMGGSRYNVSVLVKTEYKIKALRKLNSLFAFASLRNP